MEGEENKREMGKKEGKEVRAKEEGVDNGGRKTRKTTGKETG